ncbi:HNH endonuclease signature motif containing protein [Nocardioides sp. WS12]|uniref:HNH endonuclease signature motif containing protein n=1 Tax=Nocardioides sp. WS12 TaxID=2486272 RepID=UPI0015FC94DF|nr:HNH endonuclease signature motif containing protein [Nocardioides sp. WS12]
MSVGGLAIEQDELVDMSAEQLLVFAEVEHAKRLDAERNILKAAYQWAVRHNPDALPPTDKRGRERAKPAGAVGTPLITEYAAAAFAARIQTSPYGAKKLIADSVDIHHRLPKLAEGVRDGSTRAGHARHVAQATRDLSPEQAAWVDGEVAESADGRLAWSRFEALVEGKVAASAPELARLREEAAEKDRFVRLSRVNKHGIATLTVRDHVAALMSSDVAITAVAKALDDKMPGTTLMERRLAAFARMTNPDAHVDLDAGPIKPKVKINLHLYGDQDGIGSIARMEGHGPVTTAWVRQLIEHIAGQVRIAPVIDLAGQAPVDSYEIPSRLRDAVHLVHGGDIFPFAANTGRKVDIDHTLPYSQGGETRVGNLGPMTRTHHRIKTHAGWEARQPFPGIVIWRDPYGAYYLVDQTGTRRVTSPTAGGNSDLRPDLHTATIVLNGLAA